jgi:chromosome partitioning protein
VFNTVIPRNVRLAEAPSYGLPGVVFDPSAKGSQAFVEFAKEMVSASRRCDAWFSDEIGSFPASHGHEQLSKK